MNHEAKYYLECQCGSKEHLLVLEYDEEFGLTISTQSRQWKGFWKRLVAAVKYLSTKAGTLEWDGSLIQPADVPKIQEWLDQAKQHGTGTMYK